MSITSEQRLRQRQIQQALEAYRCPHCGGPADFIERELSVTTWGFNARKGRWDFEGHEAADDYNIEPENALQDAYQVECRKCGNVICWHDGAVVKAASAEESFGFDDWLRALANQWVSQKVQLEKATAELEEVKKKGFAPVGTIAGLEARVKALKSITKVSKSNNEETPNEAGKSRSAP